MPNPNLARLQDRLGHQFADAALLQRALTHRSHTDPSNERLEFLGDALLNTLVAELLFDHFPAYAEGRLTQLRAALVCNRTLAQIANELGLGDALQLGSGTAKTGGHRLDSILADAYEALVAAVYLDTGWQTCRDTVRRHFQPRLNAPNLTGGNAKSRLQEWLQARGEPRPDYQTLEICGPGHAQQFRVRCHVASIAGDYLGTGSTRRAAEQQAAAAALAQIEKHPPANSEKPKK
ncbi:MAG: ribonuclease III [Cellvibrionales bacterium]|nr:ribonuclease III [Cellvibrionales bacterium]